VRAGGTAHRANEAVHGVDAVRARASAAVDDIGTAERAAQSLLQEAEGLLQRTDALVGSAAKLIARVEPLFNEWEPMLGKLQPILARIADTTTAKEVDAVVGLIDALPNIVDKLDSDILPVVDTLATVAPDLRDLLDICKEISELIGSVPGLGRVKKQIEDSDWQDEYRALEEPPAAPDRRSSLLTDGSTVPSTETA
jgi:hypothetical protein